MCSKIDHCRAFGTVGFHEFQSCGGVEKKVSDYHRGPVGASCGNMFFCFPAVDNGFASGLAFFCLCYNFHFGNRRNTGQSFPPEPQCLYISQVFSPLYFAGGMSLKSHIDLVFRDTAAVIGNSDVFFSALSDLDHNGRRSCVNGIFHKFLHHRKRTIHYFSRSDQIRHGLIQKFYNLFHLRRLSDPDQI